MERMKILDLRLNSLELFLHATEDRAKRARAGALSPLQAGAHRRFVPAPSRTPHASLSRAHPVSRPRGGTPGRCEVPRLGSAGATRARGAGCCGPAGLLLRVCTGGRARRSCCARDDLLASASAGLLGLPQAGRVCSAGSEPETGGSCSRNRLYTLAATAAGWLPAGRHSGLASLTGSYLPAEFLWA